METQLQQVNQYDLTEFDKVASDIARIKQEGNFIPNCSTAKGYEESKRFVLDTTTPARKLLDKAHKETKAPFLATCKELDSRKKELSLSIIGVEAPHMEAYKAVDKAKADAKLAKQKAIQDKINLLDEWVGQSYELISRTQEIGQLLDKCKSYELDDEFFGDRLGEAEHAHAHALKKLEDRFEQQLKVEQAEQDQAKREAQAEKDRIAREEAEELLRVAQKIIDNKKAEEAALKAEKERKAELVKQKRINDEVVQRIKIENTEKLKRASEAEEKRLAAAKVKFDLDAIAAKKKAKQDAIEAAEAARLSEIKKQNNALEATRLAKEKREMNKYHIGEIRKAAKEGLMAVGLDEELAKKVVLAISHGEIPNVSINY